MLAERLKWDAAYAEQQLAHVVPDLNGTACSRTEFEGDRVRMMQEWVDYLDALRAGIVQFKQTMREKFPPSRREPPAIRPPGKRQQGEPGHAHSSRGTADPSSGATHLTSHP